MKNLPNSQPILRQFRWNISDKEKAARPQLGSHRLHNISLAFYSISASLIFLSLISIACFPLLYPREHFRYLLHIQFRLPFHRRLFLDELGQSGYLRLPVSPEGGKLHSTLLCRGSIGLPSSLGGPFGRGITACLDEIYIRRLHWRCTRHVHRRPASI